MKKLSLFLLFLLMIFLTSLNNIKEVKDIEYNTECYIVIGPVADDKVYRVIVEYENGDVDKELALKRLKTETLCDQILFHIDESLKYLKFCGVEEN